MSVKRRIALAVAAAALAVVAAEIVCRLVPIDHGPAGRLYYRGADGERIDDHRRGLETGVLQMLGPPHAPRPRPAFAPGARFSICYEDAAGEPALAPWLDATGAVEVRINGLGIRDAEDLEQPRPDGQYRVICLGDSFTFGWGIPEDQNWVRLAEHELRRRDGRYRLANCGAAGTAFVDEYAAALQHRFFALEPDAVLVTLCLNDLVPTNAGLAFVLPPPEPTGSALLDRIAFAFHDPFDLDEDFDWSTFLLERPADDPIYSANPDLDRDRVWPGGGPQRALRAMRDACSERGVRFAVAIWPFLQGLGPGEHYPFAAVHEQVAAFCSAEGIPFHDVLPALRGHDARDLWVHRTDWHPNPRAQRLATPGLVAFIASIAVR